MKVVTLCLHMDDTIKMSMIIYADQYLCQFMWVEKLFKCDWKNVSFESTL